MNIKNNNEDLLYSLPDFITGKLADEGIKLKISEEINGNADFRKEYELMKETYASIKDLKFSEPPVHYFNNLIPLLNERIESRNKFGFADMFRISNLLKYTLPAVTVICLIVVITFTNKNNKDENMFVQTDNTITEIMKKEIDSTITKKEVIDDSTVNQNEDVVNNKGNSINVNNEKTINQNSSADLNQNDMNIEDIFADTDDPEIDDEYFYESDFSNLSSKEQTEIINKLSNAKF